MILKREEKVRKGDREIITFDLDVSEQILDNDKKGELYRSIILYKSEEQKIQILKFIDKYQKQESMYINTEDKQFNISNHLVKDMITMKVRGSVF